MEVQILYRPSYPLAVVKLNPGEGIQTEAGAMVSMSPNIELRSEMKGGLFKPFSRKVLGGKGFFTSHYVAHTGPGEVTLAPRLPGDIISLEMINQSFYVQSGAYLAGSSTLEIDSNFGGARSFFAGEDLFLLKVSGTGLLLLASCGAIHTKQLAPSEKYIVDTSHIVAFSSAINYNIRKVAKGFLNPVTNGEGLVAEYIGPGKLYIQSRSEHSLANWLIPLLPQN